MKKTLFVAILLVTVLLIAADTPGETYGWEDVLKIVPFALVALLGAPVTQFFKNVLHLEDRWALALTGVIAAALALLQVWLTGVLDFTLLTVDSIPNAFFMVFGVATIYYQLLKDTKGFFGEGFLLKSKTP